MTPPPPPPPPKKPINLLRGWPAHSLLPATALLTASQRALSDPAIYEPGLEYGPDPGYRPLREALAGWLSAFYSFVPSASPSSSSINGGNDDDDDDGGGGGGDGGDKSKGDGRGRYSHPPDAERITITGGASQSVACVLQSFTDPAVTRAVWMVAPCYFLACPIFADAGLGKKGRLRAVPEDDEGIDLGFLERELRAVDREWAADAGAGERWGKGAEGGGGGFKDPGPYRKIYRHVVYCVPSFANPSGKTMSLARREALVRLAREFDALIICDDVYDHLKWPITTSTSPPTSASPSSSSTRALLPRLIDIDLSLGASPHDPNPSPSSPQTAFGHVVSNGSFSKLSGPGVRTGWTESSRAFALGLSQTGSTRSGGAPSQLTAAVVCEMLRSGDLDAHIAGAVRPALQRRHALLARAVERCLIAPFGARVRRRSLLSSSSSASGEKEEEEDVYGGYFVWVSFPEDSRSSSSSAQGSVIPPARAIADRCLAEENLMVGSGDLFEVHGDEDAVRFERDMRLCFAWVDEEDLVEGVERLARVIGKMVEEGESGWWKEGGAAGNSKKSGIGEMK